VIQQMREEARFLGERAVDQKALADAAQPLFTSLDDRQKRRFANELQGLGHWPKVTKNSNTKMITSGPIGRS